MSVLREGPATHWQNEALGRYSNMFLGINSFVHDASATLVGPDGGIIAAIEEERFTRKKREGRFPIESIRACLQIAGASFADISGIAFPWHPRALLLERLFWSNMLQYPVRPTVLRTNAELLVRVLRVSSELKRHFGKAHHPEVRYFRHHLAHAASAYYPSPFDEATYLTLDGRGELESMTWGRCRRAQIDQIGRVFFPHSIGKFYSAVCRFLGFHAAEKDGTVMALAGCGEPRFLEQFQQVLRIDPQRGLHGIRLSTRYFDLQDLALPSAAMEQLLGIKVRQPGEPITQTHKDIAASLQHVTQDAIIHILRELHRITKAPDLVFAGGVALNSVVNGMILERTPFRQVFIQPAAHDGGLSLGAALLLAHERRESKASCCMQSAALGPEYTQNEIRSALGAAGATPLCVEEPRNLAHEIARRLVDGEIVALFRGRMEFGPRALGNRSILADPRDAGIQHRLNTIKGREPFRPFAAAILQECADQWLCRATESPFMLLVDHFRPDVRDRVPGVQHSDGTVRIQTVRAETDPFLHDVIQTFLRLTGVPLVLNTSFNVRGEPLACSPIDAVRTFLGGGIDSMAIGGYLVTRKSSPRKEPKSAFSHSPVAGRPAY
jgi:carbamoyltransferase